MWATALAALQLVIAIPLLAMGFGFADRTPLWYSVATIICSAVPMAGLLLSLLHEERLSLGMRKLRHWLVVPLLVNGLAMIALLGLMSGGV
jgi:hypothetical protein